jgi:hypothetical protein
MNLTISEKNKIYDFISDNKDKFIYKKIEIKRINSLNFILKQISNLEFSNLNECFLFLTKHWDKKCKNINCNRERKIGCLFPNRFDYLNISNKYGIYKFCDNSECNYSSISNRQLSDNNTCHRMTDESFKSMCLKNSIKMKQNIKEGKFIPNITNSWAKSRCEIEFYRNNLLVKIKTRSTWDAYFQLYNPNTFYEKLIIQYKFNKIEHNYIIDFVDYDNKIIYEIKPNATINTAKNKAKIRYGKKWAKKNNYEFIIIGDAWFKNNYDNKLIIGQPCVEKMSKNLKQFINGNRINKQM